MLNSKQERELAYVVTIDEIRPIPGKDRVECAIVNGWTVMVRKNQFNPGDPGIYFEIDSKVPETEPFAFLAQKNYKIKTQKYKTPEGQFWSQGLLMHADDFGWENVSGNNDFSAAIKDAKGNVHYCDDDSRFLTKELGVTYYEAEDNKRKASSTDKYKAMASRHGKLFSKPFFRWMMKRSWGRKTLFLFFGKKKDKRNWPAWVKKTDEERVQNMPWVLNNKDPWIVTEKVDGSSTTFTMRRKSFGRFEFLVCSRNVVFDKPDKKCFYETNIYTEMAKKYDIENKMKTMLKSNVFKDCKWITIQGETYGAGVQKREYSITDRSFMAFNLITEKAGRWNSVEMQECLELDYGIPCVPIVKKEYILPDTVEELLNFATGESILDGGLREGFVFRSQDGSQSFKAVSNEFLERFHS